MTLKSLSFTQKNFILLKTEARYKIAQSYQEKTLPFNGVRKSHNDNAKTERCKANNKKNHLEHRKSERNYKKEQEGIN